MSSLRDEQLRLFQRITSEAPLTHPSTRFEKGLRIYQNAYRIRIEESLHEDFEQTEKALGSSAFQAEMDVFLSSPPSRYWNLSELSVAFSTFILGRLKDPSTQNLVREEIALIHASSIHLPEFQFDFNQIEESMLHLNPTLQWIEKSLKIALRRNEDTVVIELQCEEHELLRSIFKEGNEILFSRLLEIAAAYSNLSIEPIFKNFVQNQIILGNTQL